MNVYCQLGLGNRLSTIAATLAAFGGITFHWRKNADLASDWRDVFPRGIQNVQFAETERGCPSTGLRGAMAYDYFPDVDYWGAMGWLAGEAHSSATIAIHGRFRRIERQRPDELVAAIPTGTESAFVLCDAHRETIIDQMEKRGIRPILPRSRAMAHDFDRLPSDTLDFISDWKTLCLASTVVTNCPQSSALYPLRQSGAQIITA